MSGYGYTIIFSVSKYDEASDSRVVEGMISKDSQKIREINNVFRAQFNNTRYECHMDNLMLFSISFFNMKKRVRYNGMYVISLAEIKHPLFITNVALEKLLDSQHTIHTNDIYSAYPSFRFNKFHVGDYFSLDSSDKIVFNIPQTNSNGLFPS